MCSGTRAKSNNSFFPQTSTGMAPRWIALQPAAQRALFARTYRISNDMSIGDIASWILHPDETFAGRFHDGINRLEFHFLRELFDVQII